MTYGPLKNHASPKSTLRFVETQKLDNLNFQKKCHMKNKTTAGLLAIFLGDLGIHRFYLGQGLLGVMHLLFCWTLIPAFVGLVDGIIILLMSDEKFNNKYNQGMPTGLAKVEVSDELEKLHQLKEKGILSIAEFEKRKDLLLK